MTTLSWNCRGLAAAATLSELCDICRVHQLTILFLMETRANKDRIERVRRRLKFANSFVVEARGLSGGLCLLWDKKVHIQILESSMNFIHTIISSKGDPSDFECSFIYGNPRFQQRRNLWTRILRLNYDRNRLWVCLGDFNEILAAHEKDGLRPPKPIE